MLRWSGDLGAPASVLALLVLTSFLLGACASFSGYVSDHWPTWAGGMPKDVPPRPGAPGYEEFIAHQQGRNAAPAAPADANAKATPVVVSSDKVSGRTPPANQPAENPGVVQGGLY
jgi:hypothetical protein